MMASDSLVARFPEALVSFLENQIVFHWPTSQVPFTNNFNNRAIVTACTNQGPEGMKYLFSRNNIQFHRVLRSKFAVERVPALIVQFLEGKLDLNDCHPLPDNRRYGIF